MLICRSRRTAAAVLLLSTFSVPAFAVNKDMVQLQTQIQQLQEAIARLQQSNDERMGVLKDLVQQNADTVNRMSVNMDALQKQIVAQQGAAGGKVDQVSGQVQALNDSLDEMRARMARLEKLLGDVQVQTQSIGAALQNMPASTGAVVASPPSTVPASAPPVTAPPEPLKPASTPGLKPSAAIPESAPAATAPVPRRAAGSANVAPVKDLYKSAFGDYMAAKYGLATSEFNEIIKAYPDDTLAGNAFYYLGEIEYRQAKYSAAAKDYDRVLEQFPDNNKIPAAHLHKGQALIEMKQTDAGVRELRALIQRFPSSPEATQARSRLNTLGVPVKPKA